MCKGWVMFWCSEGRVLLCVVDFVGVFGVGRCVVNVGLL